MNIQILNEAKRCLNCKEPRCKKACPIHNEIPTFINLFINNKIDEAYKTIRLNSTLSEICGLICPHEKYCEGACIKGIKDKPVQIGLIESYISSIAKETKIEIRKNDIKVACIGSGPSSLAFAETLILNGYNVDIYEKNNGIGGVLYTGIPDFRLNKDILNKKIEYLKELGVNFILNKKIYNLGELINYDYIFIGIGSMVANKLNILNEDNKDIYQAYDFLYDTNIDKLNNYGEKIVVVGGGNAAMDVARSAIRLNNTKEVTVIYRRSEKEMPACKEEIEAAKNEGVIFKILANPKELIIKDNKLEAIKCSVMKLGGIDESGRCHPFETDDYFIIEADSLVLALGFKNNCTLSDKLLVDENNHIIVNENYQTNIKNIYAAGDIVTGASTVVEAMKAGIKAAKSIIKQNKL